MAGRPIHTFQVQRTERLTPHMIRVVFGGTGFDTFEPKEFVDSYVKIAIVPEGVDVAALNRPLGLDDFKVLPVDQQPTVRTYTVRSCDPVSREIAIDFVVHGDTGVAGPWAASRQPGDTAYLMGPNGAYLPDPAADWHLLISDEAGLPALSAALEALPPKAIGQAFIEVAGPQDELDLVAPAGIRIEWIHRGGRADLVPDTQAGDNASVIAAVRAADWLPGQVQVFVHGEAQTVMHNLRPYIRKERGVDANWTSISGYWRRGRTEETFRQWKAELAKAEEGQS